MTQFDFLAFYPQFTGFTPAVVLREYIAQANGRFSDFSEADMEEARRLYTAHKLTLNSFTVPPADSSGSGYVPDPAAIASAGKAVAVKQQVSSKKVGEDSVSYTTGSYLSSGASSSLADLTETAYGLQLLSLLRMYSYSVYIP